MSSKYKIGYSFSSKSHTLFGAVSNVSKSIKLKKLLRYVALFKLSSVVIVREPFTFPSSINVPEILERLLTFMVLAMF